MNTPELCPLCGEGHVSVHSEMVENDYKGNKAMLPLLFKQCDACGSDFAGATESKQNKRALMAYRKQVDGLLTGAEITALRKQYGLTQAQAAQLFGGGPIAFTKYENDDVMQSEAMDTLLRLVRSSAAAFWALVVQKGMEKSFMRVRAAVQVKNASNVMSLTVIRGAPQPVDPHYRPRKLRQYQVGAVSCPV